MAKRHREPFSQLNAHCESCGNKISHQEADECMARGERVLCIRCLHLHRKMGTAKVQRPEGQGRRLGVEDDSLIRWAVEQSEKWHRENEDK